MSIQTKIVSVVLNSGPEAAELPALLAQLPENKREAFQCAISLSADLSKATNAQIGENLIEIRELLAKLFKNSNDPAYRDAFCQLGVVELLKQIVVRDVGRFGLERTFQREEGHDEVEEEEKKMKEHGELRKLVAKVLIDLTYGSTEIKRKLCLEGRFVSIAVQIVNSAHGAVDNLALYYASLLRNLSWQVDAEMQAALSSAVTSLCYASIRSYKQKDAKCLQATLSAVFNLSAHSNDNRKEIIENVEFMHVCVELINPKMDAAKIAVGIFENLGKFLRTHYDHYRGHIQSLQLIPRVLHLLEKNGADDVTKRCLRILNFMADTDRTTEQSLLANPAILRVAQSTDEELSRLAKRIVQRSRFGANQMNNGSHRFPSFQTPRAPQAKPKFMLPHEHVDLNTSLLVNNNPAESCNVTMVENNSFNSSIHTEVNSVPFSPESCSNLPDSPVSGMEAWTRQLSQGHSHTSGYQSASGPSTVRNSPAMSKTSSDWTRANSQMSR